MSSASESDNATEGALARGLAVLLAEQDEGARDALVHALPLALLPLLARTPMPVLPPQVAALLSEMCLAAGVGPDDDAGAAEKIEGYFARFPPTAAAVATLATAFGELALDAPARRRALQHVLGRDETRHVLTGPRPKGTTPAGPLARAALTGAKTPTD